jgi:uncharacterized protein with HEPN domain
MRPDARTYLYDILEAIDRLIRFTAGKDFEDYESDDLLRSGVERQFAIIGEAIARLARGSPQIAEQIREYRRIIAFRNVIVHGTRTLRTSSFGISPRGACPLSALR